MTDEKKYIDEMIKKIIDNTKKSGSLHINYNSHKAYNETILEYKDLKIDDFDSKCDYEICLDSDTFWEIIWYRDTPIGSYRTYGSTLEIALKQMMEVLND